MTLGTERLALLLIAALLSPVWAAAALPEWFQAAMQTEIPAYDDEVGAAILFDEIQTSISENGEVRTRHRRVYKILNDAGRDSGTISVHFDDETRISSFRAWSVPPGGKEYELKAKDAIETQAFDGVLYAGNRLRALRIPSSQIGSIIGFEIEQRERPYGLEDVWTIQTSMPKRLSRFSLSLPPGWTVETHWVNAEPVEARTENATRTWEVENVVEIHDEDSMPPETSIAGRMFVRYFPPGGSELERRVHRTWTDVGRWYGALAEGRVTNSPDITAKASELVRGRTSFLDRMRAVAGFAQRDIRYVAIEIGIGGYQPHRATEIFENRYGDCKDKVTALRAMLRALGIDSHYVLVNTNRGTVRREFASIHQFNHVIVAVPLPKGEGESLPATVVHPTLGRLLLFDPTNSVTPVGQLPWYLQGDLGLLVTPAGGDIVELDAHDASVNRLERTATLEIGANGTLEGSVREVRSGWLAATLRDRLLSLTDSQRAEYFDSRMANHLPRHTIAGLTIENLEAIDEDLIVSFELSAQDYVRPAGGLLLMRPRVYGTKAGSRVDLEKRRYAYAFEGSSSESDAFTITLPPALRVDELPAKVSVSLGPLTYESESTVDTDNVLHYERRYVSRSGTVARDRLEELNRAFDEIAKDERSVAVFTP
ncbi:MAG: DUF3857 and transglutaminase domain-containing protein [Acidobacteria bacterium]|nr:DUF3857 and transglutaminase domain-containing protein [Acidobacteriota bacterium]